jgi:hypothetical protein
LKNLIECKWKEWLTIQSRGRRRDWITVTRSK